MSYKHKFVICFINLNFSPLHNLRFVLIRADIVDDVCIATDSGISTTLVLLDVSRIFNTINHLIMCAILQYLGFILMAVDMVANYLICQS